VQGSVLKGFVDVHSHILYGVDDGAKDEAVSLSMLKTALSEGIGAIIATPHLKYVTRPKISGDFDEKTAPASVGRAFEAKNGAALADKCLHIERVPAHGAGVRRIMFGNALPDRAIKRAMELKSLAKKHGIDIPVYMGNEIFYKSGIPQDVRTGLACGLNGTKYLLVEFSPGDAYSYIRDGLDEILMGGFVPVLAHAERYACLYSRSGSLPFMCKLEHDRIDVLLGMGVLFQVNANSVTGGFARLESNVTRKLLYEEIPAFIGTDAHNDTTRVPRILDCAKYLYKKCAKAYADEVLFGNAQWLLLSSF